MRFTTQWRTAFRVKSFKAVVIRGKLPGEKEGDGGEGGGRWGRLEIRDRWWRSHVAGQLEQKTLIFIGNKEGLHHKLSADSLHGGCKRVRVSGWRVGSAGGR